MKETIERLKEQFGGAVIETNDFRGDETAVINRDYLQGICLFARDELGFNMLTDLCAVDYPNREERFEIVYHLYATGKGKRLRIKVRVNGTDPVAMSVHEIWPAANWFEREAYDLFGIKFEGHPNMKRLLTFEGFEGHPLRKDYEKNKRQGIPKPDPLIKQ